MAAIVAIMAVWWMAEAIPLAATSLLPLILMPVTGILKIDDTASEYFNSMSFLFLGGFLIAASMERWNLHKRISINIIRLIGSGPSRLILGFMSATALLSMFISNTATAIMMLPIAMSIIFSIESLYPDKKTKMFSIALMLGIAYSASIGGIATPVGTPPNIVFLKIYGMNFPEAPEISFGNWMLFGLPLSLIMLAITWLMLTKILIKVPNDIKISKDIIDSELRKLGKISREEKAVLLVFVLTALLWIFRKGLDLGFIKIPGWAELFTFGKYINDAVVAILMALILFIIPAKDKGRLLDNTAFGKIPWDILLLFGGGFALAGGFQSSGLSEIVGGSIAGFVDLPPLVLVLLICLLLTFLTELTSNSATTQTILPILASVGVAMEINPLLLMVPATISASFAFMLPVATPPNAIVFGSKRLDISDMVKTGFFLNLIGVVIITTVFYLIGSYVFGI